MCIARTTRTLLFFFFFVSSAANKFAVTGTLILALFRFVRSNPQERSSRASVSPALARVARCAFVRRNTRVRKVRMVRRVRRAFPGRYRGVRARVRRSNRSRLTRRARFFWRRGAIDRRILGWRLRTGERARTHARSGFSQTGNRTSDERNRRFMVQMMTRIMYFGERRYVFQREKEGSLVARLRAFSPLVSSRARGDMSSSTRPPITRHHASARLGVSLLR